MNGMLIRSYRRASEEINRTPSRLLALQDFSRYIIAASLLPVLKLGRRGVVIDVLSAGVWNKFDDENLELVGKSPDFYREFIPVRVVTADRQS